MKPHDSLSVSIGCAGWSIPRSHAGSFPISGSHLERYASRFHAVEINSSFYRPHRPQTYAKWAASVPEHFRFAVKVPKVITHEQRLNNSEIALSKFLEEVMELGDKLGPLLVQLPPSLIFDNGVVDDFFSSLRDRFSGQVVCEPRHPSWFSPEAESVMKRMQVARVAADPAVVAGASEPGGWSDQVYYRLHGSPTIYRSSYSAEFLKNLSASLHAKVALGISVWCIFDNTAEGAATGNALELAALLRMNAELS